MLQRIVALLFALADLAEAVSHRSAPVRRIVLWLLYRAEAAARGLVLETYGPVELDAPRTPFSEATPADALRLANCFRVLAMILTAVEAETFSTEWCGRAVVSRLRAALAIGALAAHIPNACPQPFPDTS